MTGTIITVIGISLSGLASTGSRRRRQSGTRVSLYLGIAFFVPLSILLITRLGAASSAISLFCLV